MGERSDETVIGQSFFSHAIKGMGKLGCIIDISQKRKTISLASEFSKTIASLLAADNSKIVCLDTQPNKSPSLLVQRKISFLMIDEPQTSKQYHINVCMTFNDEDGMIGAGEIKKIKRKYSDMIKSFVL